MRKQPEWWAKWDDRILEYVYEKGPSSTGVIANNDHFHISQSYVTHRIQVLREHGLMEECSKHSYGITKKGRYYLAGGYDPEADEYLHEEDWADDSLKELYNYKQMGVYMRELADKVRQGIR
jgi:hypothetical protein